MSENGSAGTHNTEPFLRFMNRLPADIEDDVREQIEAAVRAQREDDDQERDVRAQAEREQQEAEELERVRQDEQDAAEAEILESQTLSGAAILGKLVDPAVEYPAAKGKQKVVMASGRMKADGLHYATPSQKIRDQIRACDFIYLWHLTPAGLAAATRTRLRGVTSLVADSSGELKIKDKDELQGFVTDVDLTHDEWTSALPQYIIFMKLEGVPDNIVEAMERVNKVMCDHPDRIHYARAIRLWHQEHRRHWALSGHKNADGARDDLGLLSKENFRDCVRRVQDGLDGSSSRSSVTAGSSKRTAPDEFSRQSRFKAPRSAFRCFICWSTDSGHDGRACNATKRVDGRPQHIIRGAGGKAVFSDSLKPVCYNFQLKGCSAPCRTGGAHRCANCGGGGHGASSCSA